MTNASSIQEHLKMKRMVLDTWTIGEKLRLASFVEKNGNQNWASVSRSMKAYFQDPDEWSWTKPRPLDWYSPKNCAQQFALLLDTFETPKRKKRSGGSEETQVQTIKRTLLKFRNDEIDRSLLTLQEEYLIILGQLNDIVDGDGNVLNAVLAEIEKEKTEQTQEEEEHQRWLKEREDRRIELERACRSVSTIALTNVRRESSLSEPSSEADSPLDEPLAVDVPEEIAIKPLPVPTPTSPLLTSLLKSPAGAAAALLPPPPITPPGSTSILHSAITSPLRGVPTVRINTSPLPVASNVVSPNIKSLVSSALGSLDDQKPILPSQSPSQGAPTLSMLLELPPSLPGKPLPVLPAPPPYSGHLGPPPPYSQATQYLQKQRAEQAAQAAQLAIKNELILSSGLPVEANIVLPTASPKTDIDLDDIEEVIAVDVSRSQFNTTDHDYVEPKREEFNQPVIQIEQPEIKIEKNELDVFDFEEEENETKTTYVNNKKLKKEIGSKSDSQVNFDIEQIVETEVTVDAGDDSVLEQAVLEEVLTEKESIEEDVVKELLEEIVPHVEIEAIVEEKMTEEQESVVRGLELEIKVEDICALDNATKVQEIVEAIVSEVSAVVEEKEKTEMVAGVKRRRTTFAESIPNSPNPVSDEDKDYKAWKKSVQMVHSRIESHKSASLFLKPINDDQAPDYSRIIKKPMDLSAIKRNLENGLIRTSEEYLNDILHMFFNAHMYNKSQSVVYKQAVEMQEDCLEHILVMMELRGETPLWWKRPRTMCENFKTRARGSVVSNTRASIKRGSGYSESSRKKIKTEEF